MSGQIIKLKGQCRWASIPPNAARKPYEIKAEAPNDTNYSIEVECDEKKFTALKKAGIPKLTELRKDEETGKTYIRVRCAKVKRVNGEDITFNDPFVVGSNGKPFDKAVGNGSEVIVVAELADMKKGKVLRLKGVQVLNHIEYESSVVDKYKDILEIDETADEESSDVPEVDLDEFL